MPEKARVQSVSGSESTVEFPPRGSAASNKLHVFLAHRHEDEHYVLNVIKEISYYCGGKVDFHAFEEIPPGTSWRDWIIHNIGASNQLWLFYTDPSGNYHWPLYEAGIFTGMKEAKKQDTRLICFFTSVGEKPDALADFEGVELTEVGLTSFLKSFYGDRILPDNTSINDNLAIDEKKISEIVTKCFSILGKAVQSEETQPYNKFVEIEFSFHGRNAEDEDIRGGAIYSTSVVTDLFGKKKLPETWGDLLDSIEDKLDKRPDEIETFRKWASELHNAIRAACKDDTFSQPASYVIGVDDDKCYLPVLHSMTKQKMNSQTRSCAHVIFVKQKSRAARA